MTGSCFLFWYLICERFNVESPKSAYNFIPRSHGLFFPSLALVWCWLCWAVVCPSRLQKARPRSVNPLKLGHSCQHSIFELLIMNLDTLNSIFFFWFSFWTSFFDDYKFYNVPFVAFLRRSTKGKEVSDWNIYPQHAFISGPQHREPWSVSPTDIPIAEYTVSSPLKSRPTPVRIWLLRLTVVVIVKPSP